MLPAKGAMKFENINYCAGAQRRRFLFRNRSFKRSRLSVRPVCPISVRKKTRKTHNGICTGFKARYHSGYFSVDFQGAEENCGFATKERFAGTLKKSTFFDFLIIKIVLSYAVLDRSEAHSSRPRTYLPSRSGATHALRVQSS